MRRNSRVFMRKIGDTCYLQCSDSDEQKWIFLNETGAFLWEKMIECETKEELVNKLVACYDVQKSTAEEDVEGFLTFLKENKCLSQEG